MLIVYFYEVIFNYHLQIFPAWFEAKNEDGRVGKT